jgi:hypothetical protein
MQNSMANFLAVAGNSSSSKMNTHASAFNVAAAAAAKLAHLFPLAVSSSNPFSIENLLSTSSSTQYSLVHSTSMNDADNNNSSVSLKQHSPTGQKNHTANNLLLSMKQHQHQNNNFAPSRSTASPVDVYGNLISITYHLLYKKEKIFD